MLVGGITVKGSGSGKGGAGGGALGEGVRDTPAFRTALKEQHDRIRTQYAGRLAELERERHAIEDEKAQVDRYKQLLLKQRDIMIALTQRLNERDEQVGRCFTSSPTPAAFLFLLLSGFFFLVSVFCLLSSFFFFCLLCLLCLLSSVFFLVVWFWFCSSHTACSKCWTARTPHNIKTNPTH